jgi:beta-glucanase (GH16 family)
MLSFKNTIVLLSFVVIFFSCQNNSPSFQKEKDEWRLVWQDEFDYQGLPDSNLWAYDTEGNDAGWGNNEAQFYTDSRIENAKVEEGKLKITAKHEDFGGKAFTSARLITKADWKYGRVEVRAKIPEGRGTWSAIWMMPGGWTFKDGNWPDIGEIDIMEHVGHNLGVIHASAHSKDYQWQKGSQKTATMQVPNAASDFNSYIFEWDEQVMKTYVNDSLYFEYKNEGLGESKWPYDKPFYLILNVAVGGVWGIVEGIDTTAFPQTMEIDYVRVFKN